MPIRITRRDFAALAGGFLVSSKAIAQTDTPLVTRAIPSSDERIPAVGLGTAYVFDQDDETTRSKADAVVQALIRGGGRLIDTASTYGDAEIVLGKGHRSCRRARQAFHRHQARVARCSGTQAVIGPTQDRKGRSAAAPQRHEQATISRTLQGVEGTRRVPLCRHHFNNPPRLSRGRGRAQTGEA